MASCIVLLNALRKDKKYKNKNVRFWVGGSQYMPAKSYAEKCEEPSIARMEEFRSPVQPSYSYSTLQSSLGIQCVGEDGERILNQVIFILWSSGLILP